MFGVSSMVLTGCTVECTSTTWGDCLHLFLLLLLCEYLDLFDFLLLLWEDRWRFRRGWRWKGSISSPLLRRMFWLRLISPTLSSQSCLPIRGLPNVSRRIDDYWIRHRTKVWFQWQQYPLRTSLVLRLLRKWMLRTLMSMTGHAVFSAKRLLPDDRCLVNWLVPGARWLVALWLVPGDWMTSARWLVITAWWLVPGWPVTGDWWLVSDDWWLVARCLIDQCLAARWWLTSDRLPGAWLTSAW